MQLSAEYPFLSLPFLLIPYASVVSFPPYFLSVFLQIKWMRDQIPQTGVTYLQIVIDF